MSCKVTATAQDFEFFPIFIDACHMLKLLRNKLGTKKILYDSELKEIKWEYIEQLVHMECRGLSVIHKLNRTHSNWHKLKMKVDIAAQTLSESTAYSSIELFIQKGVPEFAGSEPTIEFIRVCYRLFSTFNSKSDHSKNQFKRELNRENAEQTFKFFDYAIKHLKDLKVKKADTDGFIRVCSSKINTGFIINIVSLKRLYQDLVETRGYTKGNLIKRTWHTCAFDVLFQFYAVAYSDIPIFKSMIDKSMEPNSVCELTRFLFTEKECNILNIRNNLLHKLYNEKFKIISPKQLEIDCFSTVNHIYQKISRDEVEFNSARQLHTCKHCGAEDIKY